MTTTVHLVLNAHIDPVWLWPWQAGADEVLATCRSACDRLDRHPDIIFARGEAWAYDLVERVDPELFARISAHIAAGRWEVVGGWWIQPDCNHPGAKGLEMQIRLGRDYLLGRFGSFPRVAYNVDSFGHAAVLPSLMRRHGQDRYVMMRPQPQEMALPARVFRWRSEPGGPEVVTFRIARNYETREVTPEHVLAAAEDLPPGLTHTMCFVGVGDHGGGPTERQIAWCRAHADSIPGCRLEFSSPSRFFDAVMAEKMELPLVTGELQHHAIGCYSVTRSVKVAVRRAEHLLEQAEIVSTLVPTAEGTSPQLNAAWRQVCFHHFHDTLGGTCIPSAYAQVEDGLGAAKACADEIMHTGLRRLLPQLADDRRQRIVLCNAATLPFAGYTELAPWTDVPWRASWRIVDPTGNDVPYQLLPPEAAVGNVAPHVLIRVRVAAGSIHVLAIDRGTTGHQSHCVDRPARAGAVGLSLSAGDVSINLHGDPTLSLSGGLRVPVRLELFEDRSDTWGHGLVRFDGPRRGEPAWQSAVVLDDGPLMAAALQHGSIGESAVRAEWRTYADESFVELLLQVHWRARQQILKLVLPAPGTISGRVDGTPGQALRRTMDGRERPLRDFTLLELDGGQRLGVVCPDVFSLDVDATAVRLTLLRSPLMAHHVPAEPGDSPRAETADQGVHRFRILFSAGRSLDSAWLEQRASQLNFPLLSADWTRGMSAH